MATQKRSPVHPTNTLSQAIERARRLYQAAHEHWAPLESVAEALGLSVKSSSFAQAVSTLKQFGLLEEQGAGENRELKLTDTALDLISYESTTSEWRAAARTAALSPTIHAELWERFQHRLPPEDSVIRVYLVRQRDGHTFHPEQADPFIRQLRDTLEFAQVADSDTITPEVTPKTEPVVGSFVQWTSAGVDQFQAPQRVVGINGDWLFVEGSDTGIPMSETTVVDPPAPSQATSVVRQPPPVNPFFKPPRLEGPQIQFPLPDGNIIEIRLQKRVSKKVFEKIKQLVDLSEDSLVQSDEDLWDL